MRWKSSLTAAAGLTMEIADRPEEFDEAEIQELEKQKLFRGSRTGRRASAKGTLDEAAKERGIKVCYVPKLDCTDINNTDKICSQVVDNINAFIHDEAINLAE